MIALGTEVPELQPEHADGTWWADVEGDLWHPCPFGWVCVHRTPFSIDSQLGSPTALFGPYRAVLAPATETDSDT
ncbi:hypothetical protein PHELEMICH_65 [Mycobacterium phage Phelemich]|uniref:Uncharacterized protein n=2 Tax=Acadianvirus reprobate TaxID=1982903 RepID=S5Y1C7_9CAUD|nr:hypothetical protein N847_gp65 [Mycobacterium phage Phelemich]YP_008409988.1 hypothetical protein REPROBATE_67 [Mycobacterium phage Reprobate]AGT12803.1 hypothetical protein REPROBATE_67 [Mycobacterium phage Reprobate]AGT13979.1 hypothetical protein PHELEMICH_65 [Mycobacterium phage Phelemich]